MDYGKSGNPKGWKKAPKHREHNEKGSDLNPYGDRATKEDLIARMKAAAAKRANLRKE